MNARALDRAFHAAAWGALGLVLAATALVVGPLAARGAPHLTWRFLAGRPSADLADGGVLPAIVGTAVCTLLMTVAVLPLGVGTAVFLSEYAPSRSRAARVVRASLRNLAAVPSVVFGLFGLGFFVLGVGRGLDRLLYPALGPVFGRPCVLWSAATLAALTLPVVAVTAEESLRAIPRAQREAAAALGATRAEVVLRVALPQARGGILTGAILAVGRGAGEVAPILFTGVASFAPDPPTDVRDMFMHLAHHVHVLATQAHDLDAARPALEASALTLFLVTLGLNVVALVARDRTRGGRP